MASRILSGFRSKKGRERYDLWRVVSNRQVRFFEDGDHSVQFVCDIDKTYLETQFESLANIAKIAFEDARDKITVRGASELLLALRWGDMDDLSAESLKFPRPLHFVSSSPPQLRQVLEEKLTLDGLDWTSDTFKNQAYNLRKRRFDLLRHQVAYKSAAILHLISGQSEHHPSYYLLGDCAESDAYIYLGIKLLLDDRLSIDGYRQYLSYSGVDDDAAENIIGRFHSKPAGHCAGLLIRLLPNYTFCAAPPLTDPIITFDDYYDVVLYFVSRALISGPQFYELTRTFHNARYMLPSHMLYRIDWFVQKELIDPQLIRKTIDKLLTFTESRDFAQHTPVHLQTATWPDAKDFDALDEGDILELARDWAKRLEKSSRHTEEAHH